VHAVLEYPVTSHAFYCIINVFFFLILEMTHIFTFFIPFFFSIHSSLELWLETMRGFIFRLWRDEWIWQCKSNYWNSKF